MATPSNTRAAQELGRPQETVSKKSSSSSFAPAPKRRKVQTGGNAPLASHTHDGVASSSIPLPVGVANTPKVDYKAKKFALAQAQQESCVGCYRSFDSPYGNYLMPVIPTRADLFGS